MRCRLLAVCIGMIATCVVSDATLVQAQEFPSRPLRVVVAGSPGTTPDLVARLVADGLTKTIGQSVVVENRQGAAEVVGYQHVAKRVPADGYTMALVTASSMALLPVITKDLPFDPLTDLLPVIGVSEGRVILVSSSKVPWKNFSEMVAHARANPGKLNFGAATPSSRFPMLVLLQGLRLDVAYVPYSSGGPFQQGLVANDVQIGFFGESSVMTWGDKLRVIALTGETRHAAFPNVPTLAELGFPGVKGLNHSLNVPKGTPRPVIEKLHGAASMTLKQPEIRAQFAKIGLAVVDRSPEVAARNFAEEARLYMEIAQKAGIKPE